MMPIMNPRPEPLPRLIQPSTSTLSPELEINLAHGRSYFTDKDVIQGTLVFNARKDMKVRTITITFQGISVSCDMSYPKNQRARDSTPHEQMRRVERHALVHQVELLFPPPSLRANSNSKTVFKLVRGRHEYPFKFEFTAIPVCRDPTQELSLLSATHTHPGIGTLPPTCVRMNMSRTGGVMCFYEIRATVNRAGFLSNDIDFKKQLLYYPLVLTPEYVSELNSRQRMVITERKDMKITGVSTVGIGLGMFTPKTLVQGSMPISLCLVTDGDQATKGGCEVTIQNLHMVLKQCVCIRARDVFTNYRDEIPILHNEHPSKIDLGYATPVPNTGDDTAGAFSIDISHLLGTSTIPSSQLVPTFHFCNWRATYTIFASVDVTTPTGEVITLTVEEPIRLLPPVEMNRKRRQSAVERQLTRVFGISIHEDDIHVQRTEEPLPSYEQVAVPLFDPFGDQSDHSDHSDDDSDDSDDMFLSTEGLEAPPIGAPSFRPHVNEEN